MITKVRFKMMWTKCMIVFHSDAIVSIDLILFSLESVDKALYLMSEKCWKKWRIVVKKWRWKKSTSEPRFLKSSFLHTRYSYLRQLQICNCFFMKWIISTKISADIGAIDEFSIFVFFTRTAHVKINIGGEQVVTIIIWWSLV